MSRWPASQGSQSLAGALPPNPVRRGCVCRYGRVKAIKMHGCFARVRFPGHLFCSVAHQEEQSASADLWRVRIPSEHCPKDSLVTNAVPAGAGRKVRRASGRSWFRVNDRVVGSDLHDGVSRHTAVPVAMPTACGLPANPLICVAPRFARRVLPVVNNKEEENVETLCSEEKRTRAVDERR